MVRTLALIAFSLFVFACSKKDEAVVPVDGEGQGIAGQAEEEGHQAAPPRLKSEGQPRGVAGEVLLTNDSSVAIGVKLGGQKAVLKPGDKELFQALPHPAPFEIRVQHKGEFRPAISSVLSTKPDGLDVVVSDR